jgi:hypothetical protein
MERLSHLAPGLPAAADSSSLLIGAALPVIHLLSEASNRALLGPAGPCSLAAVTSGHHCTAITQSEPPARWKASTRSSSPQATGSTPAVRELAERTGIGSVDLDSSLSPR